MTEWIQSARASLIAARAYSECVRARVAQVVAPGGAIDPAALVREQHRVHGFAWIAASVAALDATLTWAVRAQAAGHYGAAVELALRIGFGEYCAQIAAALPMSATEIVRPCAFGTEAEAHAFAGQPAVAQMLAHGNSPETRTAFAALLADGVRPSEA